MERDDSAEERNPKEAQVEQHELAEEAAESLRESTADQPAVLSVAIGASGPVVDGFRTWEIHVRVDADAPTTVSLPETVDTVPVVVSEGIRWRKEDAERGLPFRRTVTVTAVDDTPESVEVRYDLGVGRDEISRDGTAILEARVTNLSESVREVRLPYPKGSSESSGPPGVYLYSTSVPDAPTRDYAPQCIDSPGRQASDHGWTMEMIPSIRLAPGETLTDELVLRESRTMNACFPVGTYRFEHPQQIDGTSFQWDFTVEITDSSV
ncbi:hypothetical protein [Haloarchaeobius sp. DFWS5]|uniref:hypothetical protein n=1 Tax=Haloarchaeobius sp. DFWS5 TaxID=3446114 RepID=UPI003EB828F2